MLKNYLVFDFGESFYKDKSVISLILEKDGIISKFHPAVSTALIVNKGTRKILILKRVNIEVLKELILT